MRSTFAGVGLTSAIVLASCASTPAPIRDAGVRTDPTYTPTVRSVSGPVQDANIRRLYPNDRLFVCGGIRVSNKPRIDSRNEVQGYSKLVVARGPGGNVPLVTAPANNACVTSGHGMRTLGGTTRMHNGIDIQAIPASRVFSGGSGTVLERGRNSGYGLSVLIDHGKGVYTRYAHLNDIEADIQVGSKVVYGQPLGLMGRSGQVTGIHLHYEILTGKYREGIKGRGLESHNPFDLPAWIDDRIS